MTCNGCTLAALSLERSESAALFLFSQLRHGLGALSYNQRAMLAKRDAIALAMPVECSSQITTSLFAKVVRHIAEVIAKRAGLNPIHEGVPA